MAEIFYNDGRDDVIAFDGLRELQDIVERGPNSSSNAASPLAPPASGRTRTTTCSPTARSSAFCDFDQGLASRGRRKSGGQFAPFRPPGPQAPRFPPWGHPARPSVRTSAGLARTPKIDQNPAQVFWAAPLFVDASHRPTRRYKRCSPCGPYRPATTTRSVAY
jgi:hypothetical protein